MAKLFEFPGTSQPESEETQNHMTTETATTEVRKIVEALFRGTQSAYVLFLPERRQTAAGIQMRPLIMPLQSPRTAPLVHVAIGEDVAKRAIAQYHLKQGKMEYRRLAFADLMRYMLRMMHADVWGCALLLEHSALIASTKTMQAMVLELQGKDPASFLRTAELIERLHQCRRDHKSFYMPVMKRDGKATPVCFGNQDPRVCPVATSRELLERQFEKMTQKPIPMQVTPVQLIERLAGFQHQTGGYLISFLDGDQNYPSYSLPFCRTFCEIFRLKIPAAFAQPSKQ